MFDWNVMSLHLTVAEAKLARAQLFERGYHRSLTKSDTQLRAKHNIELWSAEDDMQRTSLTDRDKYQRIWIEKEDSIDPRHLNPKHPEHRSTMQRMNQMITMWH